MHIGSSKQGANVNRSSMLDYSPPHYLQLSAPALVSPTIVVGVRAALSNESFEISRSILTSFSSRWLAEVRELKYSRKPIRERQAEQRSHSTISIPKTISATRV